MAVFGHVLMRALLVPIVHDEATSFLAYAQPGHLLPFASMWDANQHYLNSFLGFLGHRVFGLSLLALRWGSVLSFLLYAWSAWRIGAFTQDRRVRWMLWLALLMSPFLLDFFSLFRGYGPAMAFWLFALDGLFRYCRSGRRADLFRTLLGLAFANSAILALVPTWGIVLLILFVRWWKGRVQQPARERAIQLSLLALCGLLPFIAAAGLSIVMARLGLLYHGSTEGFVSVTVTSLMRYVFGTSAAWASMFAMAVIMGGSVVAVTVWMRSRDVRQPLMLIALLLWTEIIGRLLLAHLFGINYPEDRAALHLVPLGITLLAFAADALASRRPAWTIAAMPLLLLPMRSVATLNLGHTELWPEQSTPYRFSQRIHELEQELGRPAVVGAYRLSGLAWSLQQRMLDREGDIYAQEFPEGMHDVRIVDQRFLEEAMEGYREVDQDPGSGLHLLIREPRLNAIMIQDSSYSLEMSATERSSPLEPGVAALRAHDLFIELSGRITAPADVLDLRLEITVTDTNGSCIHGDLVFLSTRRADWKGETWRMIRYVPREPAAGSLRVFFHEPDSLTCTISDGRMLTRMIEP